MGQNSLRACPCFSPSAPLASLNHQVKPKLVSITTLGTIALSQNWCPSPPWRHALSYLISLYFFAARVSGSIVPPTVVLFVLVVAMHKSPSKCSRLNSVATARKSEPRRSHTLSRTDIGDTVCSRCQLNPKLCSFPNQSNNANRRRSLIVLLPA